MEQISTIIICRGKDNIIAELSLRSIDILSDILEALKMSK